MKLSRKINLLETLKKKKGGGGYIKQISFISMVQSFRFLLTKIEMLQTSFMFRNYYLKYKNIQEEEIEVKSEKDQTVT